MSVRSREMPSQRIWSFRSASRESGSPSPSGRSGRFSLTMAARARRSRSLADTGATTKHLLGHVTPAAPVWPSVERRIAAGHRTAHTGTCNKNAEATAQPVTGSGGGATGMRIGIVGGSIAGCAAAALLHRAGHDVIVFERSESDLVSRGAGIGTPAAVWQDMMAHGLIDETLPACRTDYIRYVTRGFGTGEQRWLGDVQMSLSLVNWAHLCQGLRRGVPGELYRSASAVESIEARPDGTTLRLRSGGSLDFDLVVCADGYRSMGRRLIDPDATLRFRGMVVWRGLLPESDLGVDPLDGCDGVRPMYQGGHGLVYYIPGSGQSTEPGTR